MAVKKMWNKNSWVVRSSTVSRCFQVFPGAGSMTLTFRSSVSSALSGHAAVPIGCSAICPRAVRKHWHLCQSLGIPYMPQAGLGQMIS